MDLVKKLCCLVLSIMTQMDSGDIRIKYDDQLQYGEYPDVFTTFTNLPPGFENGDIQTELFNYHN